MKYLFLIIILLLTSIDMKGQIELPSLEDIDTIHVLNYWGNIHVKGMEAQKKQSGVLDIIHTNSDKQPTVITEKDNDYVQIKKVKNKLLVNSRKPIGFESMDLNIALPSHINVDLHLIKGGEIVVENCKNGIEINSLNGSVDARNIGKYAIVNATNGSINITFKDIDPNYPISLVTMNGEIAVGLPEDVKRNVRLLSGKNGYVLSDFPLVSQENITNLNQKIYSKRSFKHFGKIGGGGSLLFMSTENGPLILKNYN